MRISDWSSDVCSSDLADVEVVAVCRREVGDQHAASLIAGLGMVGAARHLLQDRESPQLQGVQLERVLLSHGRWIARRRRSAKRRSEERRVGKACVSTGRYRWSRFN